MARLFIALELSERQKKEIRAFQEKIKNYLEGTRWVKPEGLHLTLKFLGETDEVHLDQIKKAMEETASSIKRFEIVYGKSGVFPSPRKARIIWVGLKEGDKTVRLLAARMDQALTRIGFEPEKRSYTPHLTIGRVRGSVPEKEARCYIDRESSFATAAHTVGGITLFESNLSPQGATYSVRYKAEFPDAGG